MKKTILLGLAALLPAALFAGDPAPTPVHHWTFDTDGTDVAGGNTMLFTGYSSHAPAFGRYGGGGIRFEPSLDTTGATSTSSVNWSSFPSGDIRTICFWAKGPTGQVGNATMFGSGVNVVGQRFDIRTAPGGTNLRVEIAGAGQNTTTPVADSIWHHIAVVVPIDGALLGDFLFYVDGVSVANANGQGQTLITPDSIVRLGDSVINNANREFNGWMDDVRIYDVALDVAQIGAVIAEADLGGASASGFIAEDDDIIVGTSTLLNWDAFALDASTLTITNDQDATVIDAKALTVGTVGSALVSPMVTTIYSLNIDGNPVGTTTVNVKTTPDILTFAASPDFLYGSGNSTLSWTSDQAMRLEITNDQDATVLTYTTSGDTQAVLDAGSVEVGPVSATTVYTLSGYLDEPGAGDSATLMTTVTVQAEPDVALVANPSVFAGPQDVTLYFNATVVTNATEFVNSLIDGFTDDGGTAGFDVQDSATDFDVALGTSAPGIYFLERLDGTNSGALSDVLSWSANSIEVADDIAADFSWTGLYRIVTLSTSGADTLVINDGSTDIFTTTDPAVIANGSFVVTGVSADTTFTATASIGGSGANMASVTVDADGTGSTYEEVILADGPLGYFPFNEQSTSTVAYDYSGNDNHSTSIAGGLDFGETGAIGAAPRFSINGIITTGITLDPADPDGDGGGPADPDTEGFTMEALINPNVQATGATQHILSNRDGTGFGRSNMFIGTTGTFQTFIGGATTASIARPLAESWCHLVVTVSYDAGEDLYVVRTYLDGTLVDAVNMTNLPEAADGAWVIGSHKNGGTYWNGLLDEIAVYDYALTDVQVTAHNAAFLSNGLGLLAFERSARVPRNEPYDLYYKVGGASSSAFIDNGGGVITPGTAGIATVTPSVDTTYTLDVDGVMKSVTLQVIDPLVLTDFGTDNGGGFPFLDVDGITPGIYYQLFTSTNLQAWTGVGTPFLGVETTNTFLDSLSFDSVARPGRHYQVRDVADPPAP